MAFKGLSWEGVGYSHLIRNKEKPCLHGSEKFYMKNSSSHFAKLCSIIYYSTNYLHNINTLIFIYYI